MMQKKPIDNSHWMNKHKVEDLMYNDNIIKYIAMNHTMCWNNDSSQNQLEATAILAHVKELVLILL